MANGLVDGSQDVVVEFLLFEENIEDLDFLYGFGGWYVERLWSEFEGPNDPVYFCDESSL